MTMPMTSKEMLKLLERNGFKRISQQGSHAKLTDGKRMVIVPIHARDLGKGLEHKILKDAGLK